MKAITILHYLSIWRLDGGAETAIPNSAFDEFPYFNPLQKTTKTARRSPFEQAQSGSSVSGKMKGRLRQKNHPPMPSDSIASTFSRFLRTMLRLSLMLYRRGLFLEIVSSLVGHLLENALICCRTGQHRPRFVTEKTSHFYP
jgi:hypothetical protein